MSGERAGWFWAAVVKSKLACGYWAEKLVMMMDCPQSSSGQKENKHCNAPSAVGGITRHLTGHLTNS